MLLTGDAAIIIKEHRLQRHTYLDLMITVIVIDGGPPETLQYTHKFWFYVSMLKY